MAIRRAILLCLVGLGLTACGGTKLVKHANPPPTGRVLAEASDQNMSATLDWVIVRDGPGTWAKNADWDEYLIRVVNVSPGTVRITGIAVFDSQGNRIDPGANRKQLVKGSKQTARRYKDSGIKIKAGAGGAGLAWTSAAMTVGGAGLAMGLAPSVVLSGGGGAAAGAAGGAAIAVLGAPLIGIYGIVRAVRNGQVNSEIERRQTRFPTVVAATQVQSLDIFFALAPSPSHVEISYADAQGEHRLDLDTRKSLAGLHLGNGATAPIASGYD